MKPLLPRCSFFNGVPKLEDGLQSFVSIVSSLPDVATDVDHSVERYFQQPSSISDVSSHSVILYGLSVQCTDQVPLNIGRIITRRNGCLVSTTELLKCHAFTECLRHFEVVLRIPIRSPKEEPSSRHASPITSLGYNPTQHLGHSWAASNGKLTSTGAESQTDATPSLQKGLRDSVAPPSPTEAKELKCEGVKTPQPVAVDGCGDTTLLSEAGVKPTTSGVVSDVRNSSPKDPALSDSPNGKGCGELPQPVAVDGCGGPPPPFVKGHGDSLPVTPTVDWTEKPVIPSKERSLVDEVLPESTGGAAHDIWQPRQFVEESKNDDITADVPKAFGSNLKQNCDCPLNAKEQPADSKPWVSALSACEILAPIPEGDPNLVSDAAQWC